MSEGQIRLSVQFKCPRNHCDFLALVHVLYSAKICYGLLRKMLGIQKQPVKCDQHSLARFNDYSHFEVFEKNTVK